MTSDTKFLDHVDQIAKEDAQGLRKAAESYGDSWKRRGGVGAFMMLARKWDRIENAVRKMLWSPSGIDKILDKQIPDDDQVVPPHDIFAHIDADTRPEGLIDDIRDLRRYLMLVEAEMRVRGAASAVSEHRDSAAAHVEKMKLCSQCNSEMILVAESDPYERNGPQLSRGRQLYRCSNPSCNTMEEVEPE